MPINFVVKTAEEVRTDILRTQGAGMRARGVANPSLGKGSEPQVRAQAVGNELEAVQAQLVVAADDMMPDTATGESLDRWLVLVGLSRRGAGPSTGNLVFVSGATSPVTTGQQLTDPDGNLQSVVTGGLQANGASIALESAATGAATNLDGETVLTWVSPPPFAAAQSPLDANGMRFGVDAEDDETARSRLLDRLKTPPNGANWSSFAGWAEDAAVAIQKAFVYPACNGPSTVHIALVGYASASTARTRSLSAAIVALASANVQANNDTGCEIVVTTVEDSLVDVSFLLSIPSAVSAVPAGIGGGWVDGVPWPQPQGASVGCTATTVTSTTDITIGNCSAVPVVGETIAQVHRSTHKLQTATVVSVVSTTGSGPYSVRVTIDTPFVGAQVGDFIWPSAENAQAYVTSVLKRFGQLGPGEKTDLAGLLPRAYRRPRSFESWGSALDDKFLSAIEDAGDEVYDADWLYQAGGFTTPDLPASIADAPLIFSPRSMGFQPKV